MSSAIPSEDVIRDRAAYWAARLNDSDVTEAEREELHDWLLADPRHAREFRAHNALVGLAREFPPDLQARLSGFASSYNAQSARASRPRWAVPVALAAALMMALVAGSWLITRPPAPQPQTFSTRTGEVRTVPFEDGSVAYLNTRTRIEWVGGKCERIVTLAEGEVLFDVPYDPSCPFRVVLDNIEIEVLGTRFNVYRKSNGETIVTVLEGKVAVRSRGKSGSAVPWRHEVAANQRVVVQPAGGTSEVQPTRAANAVRWREGYLEIQDQPVAAVLDELTRYTDQRIVIGDPRVAEFRVGGVLSVRDVRSALGRLEKVAPLRVEEQGGTFTLNYRTE